jgi:hypothetical protein
MVEEISYLIFLRRLDDLNTVEERKAQRLGSGCLGNTCALGESASDSQTPAKIVADGSTGSVVL